MSRGVTKWSEAAIERLTREGRGEGRGATYKPWVLTTDFYSLGRTHALYSHKTRRTHHLLSDGERDGFFLLEWSREVLDIREQFPLPRDITLEIAQELGIRHPYYPGTQVACVMTIDLLATKRDQGKEVFEAYTVKVLDDLNKPEVVERLEIERSTCAGMGIPYRILVKEHLPQSKLSNIRWIRDAQLDSDADEPWQGFYEEHQTRMAQDLKVRAYPGNLIQYCSEYDRRFGLEQGTGLRVARMLLQSRTLSFDLNNANPQTAPMNCFKPTETGPTLRLAVGG